jgi:5-methyltetrahydropteroyltriglutamate--homocysteine methyltransferase
MTTIGTSGLFLAHTGSYPRIGDRAGLQTLRRAISGVDRGETTLGELHAAEHDMTRRAITDQAGAGIEFITDGMIRWYDPISHLAGKLAGVEIRGLLRFFDTNFYFRQPAIMARPSRRIPLLTHDYKFAREALSHLPSPHSEGARVKVILTGPYTLAKFSLSESGAAGSLAERGAAYAEALALEIRDLAAEGADFVQIDEPAILKYPGDWTIFAEALAPILGVRDELARRGKRVQLGLYVYFRDCAPLYDKLVTLPFDVLGLDFTYNWKLVDTVAQKGSPRALGLGLIDGRNTKLENPVAVALQVEKMLPKIEGGTAYLKYPEKFNEPRKTGSSGAELAAVSHHFRGKLSEAGLPGQGARGFQPRENDPKRADGTRAQGNPVLDFDTGRTRH